jgi:hypothetical protein
VLYCEGGSDLARWGEGLYDDDVALDVRAKFDSILAGGRSPADAAQRIAKSLPIDDGTDGRHVSILALADLLLVAGADAQEITSEAIQGIQEEIALTAPVPERAAVLTDLLRRLVNARP